MLTDIQNLADTGFAKIEKIARDVNDQASGWGNLSATAMAKGMNDKWVPQYGKTIRLFDQRLDKNVENRASVIRDACDRLAQRITKFALVAYPKDLPIDGTDPHQMQAKLSERLTQEVIELLGAGDLSPLAET
jgi:hypothetical protein